MRGEEQLMEYYAHDARRLHGVVDRILSKFGGIYEKDKDDFYSLANEVLAGVCQTYDASKDFDGYVYSCLSNRIKTEITRLNREKRKADRMAVSIELPLGEEGDMTIGDLLVADFDLEREVEERIALKKNDWSRDGDSPGRFDSKGGPLTIFGDEIVLQYLKRLSKTERQIVEWKMDGVTASEIRKRLGLTQRQYERHCRQLRSFGSTCILHSREERRGESSGVLTQTAEKSKQKSYSIISLIRKMDSYAFRFDHPAQREEEQWSTGMKGNLISDILQDNPMPALVFAEQIEDGMVITWNLDGKQRCINVYEFYKDEYRISRNVRRWLIRYQTMMRDRTGKVMMSQEKPRYEWKECDIRGKKYSELPVELQARFRDYTFEVIQYLNCSSDDISYHIARYNEGKPMTQSQKGMTYLGDVFASRVKNISGMEFFKEQCGYTITEFRNGTMNQVVVESMMASNFLEDWKKQQEEMYVYLREHAAAGDFDQFEEMVERLSQAANEDMAKMFDSKDSFLWFGLFARFGKLGLADERFVEFMDAFRTRLHEWEIDGWSFDDWKGRSAKDKDVVNGKMRHLEKLMMAFLDDRL